MSVDQEFNRANEKALIEEIASAVVETLGFGSLNDWIDVDAFQFRILQTFLIVLIVNVFLISVAWKMYGPRIVDRFMKPVPSAVLEDLKQGATDLKLPREHSPRI